MLVPKPKPKTLNIALRKQGKGGEKVTSFVDCPEAGQSFHNKRAGIGGKKQLFQPSSTNVACVAWRFCRAGRRARSGLGAA